MNIKINYTDTLTLELIKQHLIIDHSLDDALLTHYQVASLELVESEAHAQFYPRTWTATPKELEIGIDGLLRLSLPVDADVVMIDDSTHAKQIDRRYWYFCSDGIIIDMAKLDFEAPLIVVDAETGETDQGNMVNQLRLLIIGEWYGSRENGITGSTTSEISTGLKRMIQTLKEVSL